MIFREIGLVSQQSHDEFEVGLPNKRRRIELRMEVDYYKWQVRMIGATPSPFDAKI
jgi:hypothetical protein